MTEWKLVKGAGAILQILAPSDGPGMRKFKPFMFEMVRRFARYVAVFNTYVSDEPLYYTERSILPILAAAVSASGGIPFSEQPVERRRREGRRSTLHRGALDLWVLHKNDVYLIEAKHGWSRFDSSKLHSARHRDWWKAVCQINEISKESVEELRFSGSILGMALSTIVLWQRDLRQKRERQDIESVCQGLASTLDPLPNWMVAWSVHPKIRDVHGYPVVMFCGWVKPLT